MKQKNSSKQNKFTKGFTLLELLVVVIIIGILAAIALPQYKLAVTKSKFATLKNTVRALAEAEERYFLINNAYNPDIHALDININYLRSECTNGQCNYFLYPAGQGGTRFALNFQSTLGGQTIGIIEKKNYDYQIAFVFEHTTKIFRCVAYKSGIMTKICQSENN